MIVDISKIAGVDGGSLDYLGEIKFEEFEYPVKVKGTVKNYSNQYVITCEGEMELMTQCARCLEDVKKVVTFSFTEAIGSEDCLECLKVVQNSIDIDEAVYTNMTIETDQKFLCKESCKGLCVVCGTNLNESECDCDTEEIDPRFEMLKNLINKYD